MILLLAIGLAALGAAACCWFLLVPLCLNRLPALPGFLLAGLAAAFGTLFAVSAVMALRQAWMQKRDRSGRS